jgi:cytoskeletal protein CcmA (bactofilin family)
MALFGDSSASNSANKTPANDNAARDSAARTASESALDAARRNHGRSDAKESLIAAELTIEGRIQGTGNVRLAGRFKGDINVEGNITVEPGARLEGTVQAKGVTIAGELHGNVHKAKTVDVLQSGAVVGDIKAEAVSIASGARIRGQVDTSGAEAPARAGNPLSALTGGVSHAAANTASTATNYAAASKA